MKQNQNHTGTCLRRMILLATAASFLCFPMQAFATEKEEEDPYIKEVYWSGHKTAKWKVSGDFDEFNLILVRDDRKVANKTLKGKSRSCSLSSYMKQDDDYYFLLRGKLPDGTYTDWEESEISEIYKDDNGSVSGGVQRSSNGPAFRDEPTATVVKTETDGAWVEDSGRWWYRHADGTFPKGTWEEIGGKWYCFDADGWMMTGWITDDGASYYCGPDGAMVTGTKEIDGKQYQFEPGGVLKAGEPQKTTAKTVKKKQKTKTPESSVVAGPGVDYEQASWQQEESTGRYWYRKPDGSYPKDAWEFIGNKWYRFDVEGWMVTGWVTDGSGTYYCGADGAMVVGNQTIDGVTYHFYPNGILK